MDKLLRNKRTILCFLLPGIIVYTISVIVPIIWSAYYSLVEWSGYGDITYVGFENFRKLMVDTEFWDSVIHTLIYAAGQIVLQVGGGLLLAASSYKYRCVQKTITGNVLSSGNCIDSSSLSDV